ncbi:MAG: hypothetical protein ACM3NV_07595, partial [Syntrophothermus sp.]
VSVDSRIERGRTYRHALARLLGSESFDRVVVPATATGTAGLSGADLVWLLEKAPAEVLILRPGPEDRTVLAPLGTRARSNGRATSWAGSEAEQGDGDQDE